MFIEYPLVIESASPVVDRKIKGVDFSADRLSFIYVLNPNPSSLGIFISHNIKKGSGSALERCSNAERLSVNVNTSFLIPKTNIASLIMRISSSSSSITIIGSCFFKFDKCFVGYQFKIQKLRFLDLSKLTGDAFTGNL